MIEIELTRGLRAIIDDEDYELVSKFSWNASSSGNGNFYAQTAFGRKGVDRRTERIHRMIMGLKPGDKREVDHINGNRLDNRRCNLRIVTRSQNMMNRDKISTNSSGFKGVTFDKDNNKWRAQIKSNGKTRKIGRFKTREEAAHAYDAVCVVEHGEFAKTNFKNER